MNTTRFQLLNWENLPVNKTSLGPFNIILLGFIGTEHIYLCDI